LQESNLCRMSSMSRRCFRSVTEDVLVSFKGARINYSSFQFLWSPSCHRSASANMSTTVFSVVVQNHYKERSKEKKYDWIDSTHQMSMDTECKSPVFVEPKLPQIRVCQHMVFWVVVQNHYKKRSKQKKYDWIHSTHQMSMDTECKSLHSKYRETQKNVGLYCQEL
jgi:hypothetical protein